MVCSSAHVLVSDILRPPTFEALLKLFLLNQDLSNKGPEDINELDFEDAGFQSSFSKLGASEAAIRRDPVADVADEKLFLSKEIAKRSAEKPQTVRHPSYRTSQLTRCRLVL
jgi:hypothetical protein